MKFSDYLIYLILVLLFFFLFNGQGLGLNVPVYAFVLVAGLSWIRPDIWNRRISQVCLSGFLLCALNFGINGGAWTFTVLFSGFLLIIGILVLDRYRSIHVLFLYSFRGFLKGLSSVIGKLRGFRVFPSIPRLRSVLRVTVLPIFIISIFVILYSAGSVYFAQKLSVISEFLILHFGDFLSQISFSSILIFALGIIFSSILFIKSSLANKFKNRLDNLRRRKRVHSNGFRPMALKTEYRSGVFLLLILNLILATLLYLEIGKVWFNFSYEGQLLKEFVHEGTELLLISIVLSMLICLYYFRGNLNFYSASKPLKILSQVWIALNILLLISAAVRVGHYIEHFGLAHKRIGLMFFMICAFIGLITLYLKVTFKKSSFYLLRVNSMGVFLVVILSTCFNWDRCIAEYNLSHIETAFYHLDYMQSLDDDALPIIYRSDEQWNELKQNQVSSIELVEEDYYLTSDYREIVERRVWTFRSYFRSNSWRSLTFSDFIAYEEVKDLECGYRY